MSLPKSSNHNFSKSGFTLIELLVVIGILSILFAIVLVAINPARQFSQANNTQRRNDVVTLLNAVHQYAADNRGTLPAAITTTAKTVKSAVGGADICTDISPTYVASIPFDPTATGAHYTSCTDYDSGYTIVKSATNNRITVTAPSAELSEVISVTR